MDRSVCVGNCVCPFLLLPPSADPLSNMTVEFDSKEEAIAYAVRSGKSLVPS